MNAYVKEYLVDQGYKVNEKAQEILSEADDWYRVRETDDHHPLNINGVRKTIPRMAFAKRAAADDANLCEIVKINTGIKNDPILKVLWENRFDTQYRKQLEETSAEGTTACYVRFEGGEEMTDGSVRGGRVRLNYVDATHYLPLTVENDEVIEAAFWGDSLKGTKKATTLLICTKPEDRYIYEIVNFDDEGNPGAPSVVELGEVKPFAIMRTAEVNSIDNMQGYGLPKVWMSIPVFMGLDMAFSAFLGDVEKSEALTFINERLCGFREDGRPIPPSEEQKKRFVFLGEKLPQQNTLIDNFQPAIRSQSFDEAIQLLLNVLSLKFGYGTKKYSFKGAEITTATQYIGERQDMMQELNKQRFQARQYIEGIIHAVVWFSNKFSGTSLTDPTEIQIEFDDSYVENRAARLEAYRQDALSGLGGAYVRQLYLMEQYNLSEEEAKKWATPEGMEEIGA